MSRAIENDHPWDESEIQYMLDRGRDKDVALNAAEFPPGSDDSEDDEDETVNVHPDIFNEVNGLELEELKARLRAISLSTKGTEVELKVLLANHLQTELDKNSGGNS